MISLPSKWWVVFGLLGPAHADELRLRGTVRDFSQSHIDMENEHAVDPGIVLMRLGDDGLPVYGDHERTLTTHGREAFDQWYRDVPGVNQSAPLVLTLSNTPEAPNLFVFSDLAFFPIDDRLGGNEGYEHNFHFTLEMHTRFVYEGGEQLTFEGDDDLWVFVNGYRVIDLGGVHGALAQTAVFDSIAAEAGLVPGETYTLDVFFAERARTESHFTLSTTAQPIPEGDDGGGNGPGGDNGLEDCIDDPDCVVPCNNGECPLDYVCIDEQCVDPCAEVVCEPGQYCVDGMCEAIPDGGVPDSGASAPDFAPPPPPPSADMSVGGGADDGSDGCAVTPRGGEGLLWMGLMGVWALRRRSA